MDSKPASEKCLLQLSELEEFYNKAYENAQIYKEKTKAWHDKNNVRNSLRWVSKFFYLTLDSSSSREN